MKSKLEELARTKNSRLILAVDSWSDSITVPELLSALRDIAVGVKIGLPLVLRAGVDFVKNLLEKFNGDFYFIADFKLADIPDIVRLILDRVSELGFDGAIVHLFPMGYDEVVREFQERRLGIYGVVLMSHRGCTLFRENFELLLKYASALEVDGVVVGATDLNAIKKTRELLGSTVLIISPGVGVQGGAPGAALRAGADFEIVGRSITLSPDPREAALKIVEAQREVLAGEP